MGNNNMLKYSLFAMLLKSFSITIALIMLNTPILVISGVTLIMFLSVLIRSVVFMGVVLQLYNLVRPILYIIALIITIASAQDTVSIIFYILMAVQVPSMIINLIQTILSLVGVFMN